MGARATSDTDNNTLYTITTLHDKRTPHATTTQGNVIIDWYNCLLSSTYIVHLRSGLTRIHLFTRVIKYALMTFLGFWILVIRSPIFDIYDLARHLASGTHCAIERSTPRLGDTNKYSKLWSQVKSNVFNNNIISTAIIYSGIYSGILFHHR